MGDFKPADLYVGVMELFTVLLPGAFLTAGILWALPEPYAGELARLKIGEAAQWVAFLFCAYALGAFVFPVAALLDRFYPRYRRWRTRKGDHAYIRATELRQAFAAARFPDARGDDPMNTFSWAKTMLMQRAPAAFADVQRYEAESKFLRSLAVALPIVGALAATGRFGGDLAILAVTALLTVLSLWRYGDQRFKSTEWAYMHVITLQLAPPAAAAPEPWWRPLLALVTRTRA